MRLKGDYEWCVHIDLKAEVGAYISDPCKHSKGTAEENYLNTSKITVKPCQESYWTNPCNFRQQ